MRPVGYAPPLERKKGGYVLGRIVDRNIIDRSWMPANQRRAVRLTLKTPDGLPTDVYIDDQKLIKGLGVISMNRMMAYDVEIRDDGLQWALNERDAVLLERAQPRNGVSEPDAIMALSRAFARTSLMGVRAMMSLILKCAQGCPGLAACRKQAELAMEAYEFYEDSRQKHLGPATERERLVKSLQEFERLSRAVGNCPTIDQKCRLAVSAARDEVTSAIEALDVALREFEGKPHTDQVMFANSKTIRHLELMTRRMRPKTAERLRTSLAMQGAWGAVRTIMTFQPGDQTVAKIKAGLEAVLRHADTLTAPAQAKAAAEVLDICQTMLGKLAHSMDTANPSRVSVGAALANTSYALSWANPSAVRIMIETDQNLVRMLDQMQTQWERGREIGQASVDANTGALMVKWLDGGTTSIDHVGRVTETPPKKPGPGLDASDPVVRQGLAENVLSEALIKRAEVLKIKPEDYDYSG